MSAWLSAAEAARYLGYSYEYFRRLVVAGKIRCARQGRSHFRFRQEWLDEFLLGQNNPPDPTPLIPQRRDDGGFEYGLPNN